MVKELLVHRKSMNLEALASNGHILWTAQVGIGRGGLREKTSMSDLITPTGDFTVDLILYQNPSFNRVSPRVREEYLSSGRYHVFFENSEGLQKLFANMNSIDFDGDQQPDDAYGRGYIGLTSNDAVTGPKMRDYRDGTSYWYSIALHDTPDPSNIGRANSGGCIHLSEEVLKKLIEEEKIDIGLKVRVVD